MSNDGAKLVPATLLTYARQMRHDPAPAEKKLWRCLRDRQLNNLKFRRQHPLGPFIADFGCPVYRRVIELDGSQHAESASDRRRDAFLKANGWRVLRFGMAI